MEQTSDITRSVLVNLASIKGDFIIPSYQRAYRWGVKQVENLLNDFYEFALGNSATFFLQPLVINHPAVNLERYELIDGQQRLTTLYLLDAVLGHCLKTGKRLIQYNIIYESHAARNKFLHGLVTDFKSQLEDADSSLDFYCLFQARQTILNWVSDKILPDFIPVYHEKLLNNVKFLWHDITLEEDSTPVQKFIRINTGRIPLADGELCRALFLLPQNHDFTGDLPENFASHEETAAKKELLFQLQYKRCITLGHDWDRIERNMWEPVFWNFIGGKNYKSPVRIGLLLELYNGIYASYPGEHVCFEKYYEEFGIENKTRDAGKAWEAILQTMERLQFWFQDNDYYHWIGYLTATYGYEKLSFLLKQARKLTEDEFRALLKDEIRKSILPEGIPALDEWNFLNNYVQCKNILFLFNIEYSRRHQSHSPRFPYQDFDLDAYTIEHVFAQNMESLEDTHDRIQWIEEHINFIREIDWEHLRKHENRNDFLTEEAFLRKKEEILDKADTFLAEIREEKNRNRDLVTEDFNAVGEMISSFIERPEEEEKHDLYNLALLDHNLNSYFNNSIFAIKQKKLRRRLLEGAPLIPAGTIALFMRHFARNRREEAWWTKADQEDYRSIMIDTLREFWPELNEEKLYSEEEYEET